MKKRKNKKHIVIYLYFVRFEIILIVLSLLLFCVISKEYIKDVKLFIENIVSFLFFWISDDAKSLDLKVKLYFSLFFLIFSINIYIKLYGKRLYDRIKYGGIVKEKKVSYYRDLPKNNNLEVAFASLYYCSSISFKTLKKGLVGAFILKWARDGYITIKDNGNNVYNIDLKDGLFDKTKIEQELYDMFKKASLDNNIINNKEFKKWTRKNKKIMNKWYDEILSTEFDCDLKKEAEQLIGLKKFLIDYSIIDERKHIEVYIWEYYLIYAQLLGISDTVNEQFKQVYPNNSRTIQLAYMNYSDPIIEVMDFWDLLKVQFIICNICLLFIWLFILIAMATVLAVCNLIYLLR